MIECIVRFYFPHLKTSVLTMLTAQQDPIILMNSKIIIIIKNYYLLLIFGSQRYLISYPRLVRVIKGDCTSMIAAHSSLYPHPTHGVILIYSIVTPVSLCGLMKVTGNLDCFLLKSEIEELRN